MAGAAGAGCELSALISHLTRQLNEPLSEPEVRCARLAVGTRLGPRRGRCPAP